MDRLFTQRHYHRDPMGEIALLFTHSHYNRNPVGDISGPDRRLTQQWRSYLQAATQNQKGQDQEVTVHNSPSRTTAEQRCLKRQRKDLL